MALFNRFRKNKKAEVKAPAEPVNNEVKSEDDKVANFNKSEYYTLDKDNNRIKLTYGFRYNNYDDPIKKQLQNDMINIYNADTGGTFKDYETIKKIDNLIDDYLAERPADYEIRGYKTIGYNLDASLDKDRYEHILLLGEADYNERITKDYDKAKSLYASADEVWKKVLIDSGIDLAEVKSYRGANRIRIINNMIINQKKKELKTKITAGMKEHKDDPVKLNELIPLLDDYLTYDITANQTAKVYVYYGDIALANDNTAEALAYYKKSLEYKEFKNVLKKIEKLEQ